MKTTKCTNKILGSPKIVLGYILVVAAFLLLPRDGRAQLLPPDGGGGGTKYTPLNSWSFTDTNGWTSDNGTVPVSFTNVSGLFFGDWNSLIMNSTNPAWVQYNVIETNSTTNLTLDVGSISFWFAPAWTSSDQGGNGPGTWGRLTEVGRYSSDASAGWWSLLTDNGGTNLYFMVQPGDGSTTTYLQAPISWISNYWHCITLTYDASNTILYVDGTSLTNGPGITAWPGTNVTAGGFFIGSDGGGTGLLQAQGAFDDLYTYNVPLDSNTVYRLYEDLYPDYYLMPNNWFFVADIISAPSNPSTNATTPDVITGPGNLQAIGSIASITSSNLWIADVSEFNTNGSIALAFTVQGGYDGMPYDVYANSILDFSSDTNKAWAWMGQSYHGNRYVITGLPSTACFLILAGATDSDGDGLTDAYERLVSKTDPHNPYSNLDGILDGWAILMGFDPKASNFTSPAKRSNYNYTDADWLQGISGVRTGNINTDNEGNVLQVSQ